MRADPGRSPLRVVFFGSGRLSPVDRVLIARLAADPVVAVSGVVVGPPRRRSEVPPAGDLGRAGWRGAWSSGRVGWRALGAGVGSILEALGRRLAVSLFDLLHSRPRAVDGYERLAREAGILVYRLAARASAADLVRSLRPELGIILGRTAVERSVLSVPDQGTLAIRKGTAGDGTEGPVGYWEVSQREPSVVVTIASVLENGRAGPVLGEAVVPIEACDTLESLAIKTDIEGAILCHETIRRVAHGDRAGASTKWRPVRPRSTPLPGPPRPSWLAVADLRRRLRQRSLARTPVLRARPSPAARFRLFVQYLMVLPWLISRRRRLVRGRRAPVCVLFYHSVANHPVNHMCLPLETFVAEVEFLQRSYDLISLDAAVERVRSGQSDRIAVVLSFDDGYRASEWAIRYLEYFGIPASFFVSIGHIRDGSRFEHDLRAGFHEAWPMREADVRRLALAGFVVGSHGLYHEDFGRLEPAAAEQVLCESRELIGRLCGQMPEHFSFPVGQRGRNITRETFELALKHYQYIHSAYGGYNFPAEDLRHILRIAAPTTTLELAMVMDGYTGFRQCLRGNAWGFKTHALSPY